MSFSNRLLPSPRGPRLAPWVLGLALLAVSGVVSAQETAEPEPVPEATVEAEPSRTSEPVVRQVRRRGERVSIFGDRIVIPADVYQDGAVVAFGSDVVIDGSVREDVFVFGGSLSITGSVRGSVVAVLSDVELHGARIGDQLINVAGTLDKHDTEVLGQTVNVGGLEWLPDLPSSFGVLGFLIFWGRMFKLLLTFIVVLMLVVLVPERVRVISDETPSRYVAALFVGLLGYLGMFVVIVLLSATLIGLPIGIFLFVVLKWLGIVGIFHAIGRRIGRSMGREMSLLGAVLLVFVPYALLVQLPLFFGLIGLLAAAMIGTFLWLFVEVPGLGMTLMTRAGGPRRPPRQAAPPAPPAPPVPPTAIMPPVPPAPPPPPTAPPGT